MTFGMWHGPSPRSSQQQARRKDVRSLKNGQRGSVGIFIGVPHLPNLVLATLYLLNGNHSYDMLQINMPTTLTLSTRNVTTRNFHQESGLKLVSFCYHIFWCLGSNTDNNTHALLHFFFILTKKTTYMKQISTKLGNATQDN